jgi:CheY-like chemotaxis protein
MSQPLRILYVEDNPVVREVTAELLQQEQREIIALGSAEEALDEFRDRAYDLLITDVSLPEMSGIDLARKILGAKPHQPIIVASGYALDFGVAHFGPNVRSIIKPFTASEIDALITALLGRPA